MIEQQFPLAQEHYVFLYSFDYCLLTFSYKTFCGTTHFSPPKTNLCVPFAHLAVQKKTKTRLAKG